MKTAAVASDPKTLSAELQNLSSKLYTYYNGGGGGAPVVDTHSYFSPPYHYLYGGGGMGGGLYQDHNHHHTYLIQQMLFSLQKYFKYAVIAIGVGFAVTGFSYLYGLNVDVNYDDPDSVERGRKKTRDALYLISFVTILCAFVLLILLFFS